MVRTTARRPPGARRLPSARGATTDSGHTVPTRRNTAAGAARPARGSGRPPRLPWQRCQRVRFFSRSFPDRDLTRADAVERRWSTGFARDRSPRRASVARAGLVADRNRPTTMRRRCTGECARARYAADAFSHVLNTHTAFVPNGETRARRARARVDDERRAVAGRKRRSKRAHRRGRFFRRRVFVARKRRRVADGRRYALAHPSRETRVHLSRVIETRARLRRRARTPAAVRRRGRRVAVRARRAARATTKPPSATRPPSSPASRRRARAGRGPRSPRSSRTHRARERSYLDPCVSTRRRAPLSRGTGPRKTRARRSPRRAPSSARTTAPIGTPPRRATETGSARRAPGKTLKPFRHPGASRGRAETPAVARARSRPARRRESTRHRTRPRFPKPPRLTRPSRVAPPTAKKCVPRRSRSRAVSIREAS